MSNTALLLIYHGSRSPKAAQESQNFACNLQKQSPHIRIRHAYLEIQSPSIEDVVAQLYSEGIRHFRLLPLFITAGKHVTADIPEDTEVCRQRFADAKFEVLDHIGMQQSFADSVLAQSQMNS